ncbi:MAG: hypothetical protein IPK07_11205 [Deltaproteobacteria bacterium]|jgi:hypothetical protein|nr:hypothetical protein [Deltaproteobacteria bacterium]
MVPPEARDTLDPSSRSAGVPAPSRPTLALAGIVAAHVVLCLTLATSLNVWLDEAFSLETSGLGLGVAFRRALDFEMQPPAYFTLLAAWRTIADGYVFARVLSILCTAAALAVTARLWRRLCPRIHPGWVVAVLAFHPFTVYAAVEIRLYALAILLSVVLLDLYLTNYFDDHGATRSGRAGFTAASVAALWTQFYLGFLLAVLGGVLVLRRRWRAVGAYLAAMTVAAVALVPFVPGVTGQLEGHTHGVDEPFGILEQAKFVYQRVAYYTLPRETESPRAIKLLRDAIVLAGAGGLAVRFARRDRPRLSPATWGLGLVVAGLLASFVGAVVITRTQDLVLVRHTVGMFVPAVLVTFLIAAETGGRRAVAATAAVVLAFEVADLATVYLPHPAKRGDWMAVARYIEAREKPGEPILVFRAPTELPLAIHYRGVNPIVPVPRANDRDHWVLEDAQIHSTSEVVAFLETLPGQPRELWLVTDTIWSSMGISFGHDILDRALSEGFVVKDERSFFASRVRLLERR